MVNVNENDATLIIDFSTNAHTGRKIMLPTAAGRTGFVYNLVTINLPPTASIPANLQETGSSPVGTAINVNQLNVSVQSAGTTWHVINRGGGY